MYLSTDDARSDFFLASATYLLGGILIRFLLDLVGGVFDNEIGLWFLTIAIPILIIAAMPLFLMRYRDESWSLLWAGGAEGAGRGAVLGLVVAAGAMLGSVLGGSAPLESVPLLEPGRLVVARLAQWLSLAVLVVFLHRRGEYAFRPISERYEVLTRQAGIAVLGAAGVASLLLLPAGGSIGLLGGPIGFAVAYLLATRTMQPSGMGERWQVWAPLIVLAIGEIAIFSALGAQVQFVAQVRSAGMVCAFGLLSIMALDARRGGVTAFAMAAVIAVGSPVTAFGAGL